MIDEKAIINFCSKCRGEPTTVEYILNDTTQCNFCDMPYIILELQKEGK